MTKSQLLVENWNLKHPVGTAVTVLKDNGDRVDTITRSQAEIISRNTPVIFLSGISGFYLLNRVKPRDVRKEANAKRTLAAIQPRRLGTRTVG